MEKPTSTPPELMIYVESCPHDPEHYVTGEDGTCSCHACEAWARWGQRILERELSLHLGSGVVPALERVLTAFKSVLAGQPVRDADETIREAELTLETAPRGE